MTWGLALGILIVIGASQLVLLALAVIALILFYRDERKPKRPVRQKPRLRLVA